MEPLLGSKITSARRCRLGSSVAERILLACRISVAVGLRIFNERDMVGSSFSRMITQPYSQNYWTNTHKN
jgi:hypothetical protein